VQSIKEVLKKEISEDILKNNFYEAMKDPKVKDLRDMINIEDKDLYKYTSLLIDSSIEFNNCSNCKGLDNCQNQLKGYSYYPKVKENKLEFYYRSCKYLTSFEKNNAFKKNIDLYNVPINITNAKIKDIYADDKSRTEVLKYIVTYEKSYKKENLKGLYLSGNFGSGKTYLIAALFNELAKKEVKSAIVYYPEFLRTLKSSFSSNEDGTFSDKYEYIRKIPLLLLDDIGAENVTAWGRDEILGTLLQYRMENNLPTFFTSNLTIEELELHLSLGKDTIDKLKARRIIERIKYLTIEMKLIGINRRN